MLSARIGSGAAQNHARVYVPDFSVAEFAKVDGGGNALWCLGGTTGLDWTDPTISSGHMIGTQDGAHGFDDSIAEFVAWDNVTVSEIETTLFVDTVTPPTGICEAEHLHRRHTSANVATGYECNFARDGSYADIVAAWKGPKGTVIGDFIFVVPTGTYSVAGGFTTGMRLKTRVAGDPAVITCWIDKNDGNGYVLLYSVTDTTGVSDGRSYWKAGRLGLGAYREASNNAASHFGQYNPILRAVG